MRQLRYSGRGFTIRGDEPLDLRINSDQEFTAADLINGYSKEELYELFTKNIEDIATIEFVDALVRERFHKKISTVGALKKVIETLSMNNQQRTNFLRKVLQGLRIIVNHEVENVRGLLASLQTVLKNGGMVCIITFYSTEDRLVKLFFKQNPNFKSLGKPRKNTQFSFAKSAQLRIYQKI
jgi:16S rRNA (cytosine1402-N4)-methyltransferase